MDKRFCAKCGALLGKQEYNFCQGVEGVVCDACGEDTLSHSADSFDDRIAQRYDLAPAAP